MGEGGGELEGGEKPGSLAQRSHPQNSVEVLHRGFSGRGQDFHGQLIVKRQGNFEVIDKLLPGGVGSRIRGYNSGSRRHD